MSTSGNILVLLSLSTTPEQPRVLMRAFNTLEFCEAAGKKLETLGTVWGCLPGDHDAFRAADEGES